MSGAWARPETALNGSHSRRTKKVSRPKKNPMPNVNFLINFLENETLQIAVVTHEAKRTPPISSESVRLDDVGRIVVGPEGACRFTQRYTVDGLVMSPASPGQNDSEWVGGFRLTSCVSTAILRGSYAKDP